MLELIAIVSGVVGFCLVVLAVVEDVRARRRGG